jgi:hypothetical protein
MASKALRSFSEVGRILEIQKTGLELFPGRFFVVLKSSI